jgi:hypothetical protein
MTVCLKSSCGCNEKNIQRNQILKFEIQHLEVFSEVYFGEETSGCTDVFILDP